MLLLFLWLHRTFFLQILQRGVSDGEELGRSGVLANIRLHTSIDTRPRGLHSRFGLSRRHGSAVRQPQTTLHAAKPTCQFLTFSARHPFKARGPLRGLSSREGARASKRYPAINRRRSWRGVAGCHPLLPAKWCARRARWPPPRPAQAPKANLCRVGAGGGFVQRAVGSGRLGAADG